MSSSSRRQDSVVLFCITWLLSDFTHAHMLLHLPHSVELASNRFYDNTTKASLEARLWSKNKLCMVWVWRCRCFAAVRNQLFSCNTFWNGKLLWMCRYIQANIHLSTFIVLYLHPIEREGEGKWLCYSSKRLPKFLPQIQHNYMILKINKKKCLLWNTPQLIWFVSLKNRVLFVYFSVLMIYSRMNFLVYKIFCSKILYNEY